MTTSKRAPRRVGSRVVLLVLLLLTVALVGPPVPARAAGWVSIRYLGNEGFLISAGETKVLIDALYGEGLEGYPVVPAAIRRQAKAGDGDFAGVDLVLATHRHGDHFDAAAVACHLDANRGARFVSTEEATARLLDLDPDVVDRVTGLWPAEGERVTVEPAAPESSDLRITALRLHHGDNPAQNLGFLVEIGGLVVMHLGDADVTAEELRPLDLAEEGIDVVLAPYWFWDATHRPALDELGARHRVAMHLPVPEAPAEYFAPAESLDALVDALRTEDPEVWIPLRPLEEQKFRPPPAGRDSR
jgi:L-ascorbate metabolism protein UlaG (beta-lactamase superfamily)